MMKPTISECMEIAKNYNTITISEELLADTLTPIGLLHTLRKENDKYFLLESVEGGEKWGRFTFLGADPKLTLSCKNGVLQKDGKISSHQEAPIQTVRNILSAYRPATFDYLPPFCGGFVGYFSYDALQYFEPSLNFRAHDDLNIPDFTLMLMENVIAFDHYRQKLIIMINISTENLEQSYRQAQAQMDQLLALIENAVKIPNEPVMLGTLESNMTPEEHKSKVNTIKQYIRNGDIFQAVLAQRFRMAFKGDLLQVYRSMRTINPSPYMYYLSCGDLEIAGASPETLVKVIGGTVYTLPIAGTRPRGGTPETDRLLESELLADEKELSEHNMLVDLGRNDVGKVSRFGSVKVSSYMKIKKLSHVMHIASEVEGVLDERSDSLDALSAIFPAGTLSGAPKFRACQIIDALEPNSRGIYGGAIGYVDFAGNLDMCIAIRTIVRKDDTVYMGAGGGIVADSVPETEYHETFHKAGALLAALEKAKGDFT